MNDTDQQRRNGRIPDGLPCLGQGERYFHASFEILGESEWIEGVVAARDSEAAGALLVSAEAHERNTTYMNLSRVVVGGSCLTREVSVAEACELLPKVRHVASMWKVSAQKGQIPKGVLVTEAAKEGVL